MNMDMSTVLPKDQLNHLCFICLLLYFQSKCAILNQCCYTHQLQFVRPESSSKKHSSCAALWQHLFTRTASWQIPQKCSDTWNEKFPKSWPFHSQDLISNSPYYLPYNSYDVSSENLVLDQLIIPWLIFFSILITCLLDIVLIL